MPGIDKIKGLVLGVVGGVVVISFSTGLLFGQTQIPQIVTPLTSQSFQKMEAPVPKGGTAIPKTPQLPKETQVPSLCEVSPEQCPSSGKNGKEKNGKEKVTKKALVKEKEEIYRIKIDESFTPGQVFEGVYYVVEPEKTTMVRMSNVDINRIVCPLPIQDVVFSEEKGVVVKVIDRNAFVKFKVKKIGESFQYSETPVDIHVVCNNKVYSLIAFPAKVPAALIYLEDKELTLKEKVDKLQNVPFEERITTLVKQFFSGNIPPEAEFKKVDVKHNLFTDLEIEEKAHYEFEGENVRVKYFVLTYIGDKPYVDLNERMFLRKEITVSPYAISIEKLRLKKGEKTGMIVIERKREIAQEVTK